MSKTEDIANLISECLDRCRSAGFTLSTLIHFLDEMRTKGYLEADVQHVDGVMRHVLKNMLDPPEELPPVDIPESPTEFNATDTTRLPPE